MTKNTPNYHNDDPEVIRRKKAVEEIMKLREKFKGIDLTKIVIHERDKEYWRWKQLSKKK